MVVPLASKLSSFAWDFENPRIWSISVKSLRPLSRICPDTVGIGEAQALMQIKNAHCHTHACDEPVAVERFVEEIINAGIHRVQIVGFSRARAVIRMM